MQRFLKGSFFFIIIAISSCTKDKLPVVIDNCDDITTYNADVKLIIDKSCAYSGCHVTGFVYGNHSSYISLKEQLDNGLFKKLVLDERQMPPQYAPVGKPKALSQQEIELIYCWAKSGYPEE